MSIKRGKIEAHCNVCMSGTYSRACVQAANTTILHTNLIALPTGKSRSHMLCHASLGEILFDDVVYERRRVRSKLEPMLAMRLSQRHPRKANGIAAKFDRVKGSSRDCSHRSVPTNRDLTGPIHVQTAVSQSCTSFADARCRIYSYRRGTRCGCELICHGATVGFRRLRVCGT